MRFPWFEYGRMDTKHKFLDCYGCKHSDYCYVPYPYCHKHGYHLYNYKVIPAILKNRWHCFLSKVMYSSQYKTWLMYWKRIKVYCGKHFYFNQGMIDAVRGPVEPVATGHTLNGQEHVNGDK